MVGSFYVHLLSNTKSASTSDSKESNKTSEFTVRLPRKLEFNTPWRVGLTNIIYPYSWPNIGTDGSQYMDVEWRDGCITRVKVPSKSYRSVQDLTRSIKEALE